jgi:hypothetical protein|tara:strand:- start:1349 stop:2335 length:987 start_codon:yes stop_codon:yes gene_type:complete
MVDNNIPPNMGNKGMQMGMPQQPSAENPAIPPMTPTQAQPMPVQAPVGNPLVKHLRQPKIYIKLPSEGHYWPQTALTKTENGEYPVFAMTAKDEITFKTPDALLNGQATVEVIQSCMPNIKDAWQTPSIDLDAILVAIRMASFGETIELSATVPGTEITKEFQLNLQTVFDNLISTEYVDTFQIDGFKVQIKPATYQLSTQQAIKAFEEQRIFSTVNDDSLDDGLKLERFQKSFANLTDININAVVANVVAIQPDGDEQAVTNPKYLREFLEGAEAKTYNQIADYIKEQKERFTQKPLQVTATPEEIEAGASKVYEIPIVFDQSNFFG